ncbi:hypothetical protein [Streptomyces sp. NPDC002580]|uniref:hypothetical protein n=1 Tax=Streptomyces sp. NPDC002580 TaxID=3364653 RepID=UPI003698BBFC
MSEIFRLEADRSYLCPGDVGTALRLWKNHVRRPERLLWQDHEGGDLYGECCGDPHEARILLDTVTAALSPRGARELRGVVGRWDAVWNRVSRPHGPRSG